MADFTGVIKQLDLDERIRDGRFREIAVRLADQGGIYPDDSELEKALYEDAMMVEMELADYFDIIGCRLVHNRDLRYMRLFPPGATSPIAMQASTEEGTALTLMRRRTSPFVAATALALRILYAQKISTGDVIGDGEVQTTVEEIRITIQKSLRREFVITQTDRRAAMRELERTWRVIRIAPDLDPDDPETRVVVRPMLADIVSESIALRAEAEGKALAQDGKEAVYDTVPESE
jgi:hypothetical protein